MWKAAHLKLNQGGSTKIFFIYKHFTIAEVNKSE